MSPFPAVFQDVSLVVGLDVAAQAVIDALREGAGELLEDVQLFDVYTGPQIGEGHKSLALALRFRAADRTLTEDEASAARDAAVQTRRGAGRRRPAHLTSSRERARDASDTPGQLALRARSPRAESRINLQ